jgi:hypothetical protein
MGKKVAVGQWGVCPFPRGRKSVNARGELPFSPTNTVLHCIIAAFVPDMLFRSVVVYSVQVHTGGKKFEFS